MYGGMRARGWTVLLNRALALRRPLAIVETGIGRDSLSTWLFSDLAHATGGHVYTVDIDPQQCALVRTVLEGSDDRNVTIAVSDSVEFLRRFDRSIDVLYLDSVDIDWQHPEPSMKHHLDELMSAKANLARDAVVGIDDTPASVDYLPLHMSDEDRGYLLRQSVLPGKGRACIDYLDSCAELDARRVFHEYQVVYQLGHVED
jgi:hypothetical protein